MGEEYRRLVEASLKEQEEFRRRNDKINLKTGRRTTSVG